MATPELRGPGPTRRTPGLLGRIIAAVLALAALVVGVTFGLFLLAIAAVLGIALFGWIWWKMRRAIRQAREDPRLRAWQDSMNAGTPPRDGRIIEGEVIDRQWKDPDARDDK